MWPDERAEAHFTSHGLLLNEHKNFQFDSKQDILISSESYEESGEGLNVHLLPISYRVFHILGEAGQSEKVTNKGCQLYLSAQRDEGRLLN